jgi:hypothetical protein
VKKLILLLVALLLLAGCKSTNGPGFGPDECRKAAKMAELACGYLPEPSEAEEE